MQFNRRHIRFVAGLHGNERGPVRALAGSGHDFVLGNPQAFERNVRFIERDLNASFGVSGSAHEIKRAKEMLQVISPLEVVVDFHTTRARGPTFTILVDKAMLPLARRTGLSHAVLMTHNIKAGHALLNHRDGISVEIGGGYDTEESYEETLRIIEHIKSGKEKPLEVYEVYGRITTPGIYENFVQHESGIVPIFVGETTYDFIGLKSRKLDNA